VGCRPRDNQSGSTGGAVIVRSTILEQQVLGESSARSGSVADVAGSVVAGARSRLKFTRWWSSGERREKPAKTSSGGPIWDLFSLSADENSAALARMMLYRSNTAVIEQR
jgi:hypothetical protein